MIKFNRVFKVYEKNIKALDDINIEIAKGEFVFLTGPSGAGKSTILKLLYREEIPTMGTIFIDNKETKSFDCLVNFHSQKLKIFCLLMNAKNQQEISF